MEGSASGRGAGHGQTKGQLALGLSQSFDSTAKQINPLVGNEKKKRETVIDNS